MTKCNTVYRLQQSFPSSTHSSASDINNRFSCELATYIEKSLCKLEAGDPFSIAARMELTASERAFLTDWTALVYPCHQLKLVSFRLESWTVTVIYFNRFGFYKQRLCNCLICKMRYKLDCALSAIQFASFEVIRNGARDSGINATSIWFLLEHPCPDMKGVLGS